ncbi:selenide, water dikinase SelD [Lacrimispora sp.]|uniref:selenide, water dikinase SelD n=1 Tax=Lacrimispora sp. TaxID=2719234 RepID=UPI0028A8D989|nr:selenide, water dikinase SelD [Lacrimispora sp.]
MDVRKINKFTSCGGCIAKLPQGMLKEALLNIPLFDDKNLIVGFDTSDDGAVYQLTDELAIIQTLDFFPPMVEDPYLFGKIAAANALSDIYAMGGEVKVALNMVCFPEDEDPAILGEILRGGAEKVKEAGGVLSGGHSIADKEPKYGLSVTGIVNPQRIMRNNNCSIGDDIILTKPLGVGLVTSSYKAGEASIKSFEQAVDSMQTLNKYGAEASKKYRVHASTDVTGFGFLGHLNEMVTEEYTILVDCSKIHYIEEAYRLAEEYLITGGGQKNRKYLKDKLRFEHVSQPMQEILFDPQTSGGLLFSVDSRDTEALLKDLGDMGIVSSCVASVITRQDKNLIISG